MAVYSLCWHSRCWYCHATATWSLDGAVFGSYLIFHSKIWTCPKSNCAHIYNRGNIQDFEGDPAEPTGHESRWSTETICGLGPADQCQFERCICSIGLHVQPTRSLHAVQGCRWTALAALCSTDAASCTAVAAPMIKPKSSPDCTCSPCATYKLDLWPCDLKMTRSGRSSWGQLIFWL